MADSFSVKIHDYVGVGRLTVEVEINDPVLLRYIKKGWIRGVSQCSDGSFTYLAVYPWWHRLFMRVKMWAKRLIS